MVVSDQDFIEALISTGGIYSHAAKKLKITRQSVTERVNNNPEIKQIVDSLAEVNLDEAESELQKMINGKKINTVVKFNAIKFYLSTKGKKRGYVEKTEVEHSGHIKTADDMTDEEIVKRIAELRGKQAKNDT